MDIAGQWLTGLMPHFVWVYLALVSPDQILILQISEVDVGMEWSTYSTTASSAISVYGLLLFFILAVASLWIC